MTAALERIALIGTIRVYDEEDGFENRARYKWAAGVKRLDDETCELVGAMTAPTHEQAMAVRAELVAAGFKRLVETRIVNGVTRTVEHRL